MNDDLIKRGHAIVYAVSGCVRNIDGEDWIRTSGKKNYKFQFVKLSLTRNRCRNLLIRQKQKC